MMSVTRRDATRGLLAAGACTLLPGSPSAWASDPGLPPLKQSFDPARLPSQERLWSWIEALNSFGPRLTGSEAHRRSLEFIATELTDIGLQVQRDSHRFRRWHPKRWELSLQESSGSARSVPVSAYFPYSGVTPASGVTAPLVYLGKAPDSFESAAGKIAIVEVDTPDIGWLLRYMMFTCKTATPDQSADFPDDLSTPLIGGLLKASAIQLGAAAKAGVRGVICVWRNCSEQNALNQYLPFTTPYQDCPALWVGARSGALLQEAAKRGARATLTMEADLDPQALTETLYAVLPGTNAAETIIINTHTDGPNACEENGPAGLLALARYAASLPKEARQRSLVFVFATGHFQMPEVDTKGQATSAWLCSHPELWDGKQGHARAVAGLTLEHLGCTEWKDDEQRRQYRATGQLERELVYTTNATMEHIYADTLRGRTKVRSLTLSPRNKVFIGEGAALYDVGIPSISMCPIPDYLCTAPADGDIGKLDPAFAHQQVTTFAKAMLHMDAMSRAALGVPDEQTTNLGGYLLRFALGA
jgi:hypothetical protein